MLEARAARGGADVGGASVERRARWRGPLQGRRVTPWSPLILSAGLCCAALVSEDVPRLVSFPTADGGEIWAHLYRGGGHGVVLAHGAVFDKESWSEQARELERRGFTVLAIDFRGYGRSRAGTEGRRGLALDVAAAVRFLNEKGAGSVSIVGGSMGARAAALACQDMPAGAVDRLVLLAPPPFENGSELAARAILFVVSEDDGLRAGVERAYAAAPEPKRLELLPGAAHAQHVFATDQGERLLELIVSFLGEER